MNSCASNSCGSRASRRLLALALAGIWVATLPGPGVEASPTPDGIAFFESKIRPVLVQHCYQCHSAEALRAGKLKAELLVDTRAGMAKGGESGAAVVPGKKEASLLLAALKYDGFEMPPTGKLPDAVIADFEKWIDMGAPDPRDEPVAETKTRTIDVTASRDHWSYRRLAPVSPPAVKNMAWPRNEIDRFVLAKQEAAGITPNGPAAKETLARRVCFDLTGLPPTPGELKLFLGDSSADAYEKLVDRLLASPRYGERWARHWLDTVRFAESGGYEFDANRPGAHHYRDFVIRALNADMPYDEFLRLQVAGDVLRPGDYDAVSATGFFVAGPYPGQLTAKTAEPIRYDQLDDMVQALGSGMLGMTIGCARCHDHKYDAISHRDYYAMIACLKNTAHTTVNVDRDPEATRLVRAEWMAKLEPVAAVVERFRKTEFAGRLVAWLAGAGAAPQAAAWLLLDPQQVSATKATLVEEKGDAVIASGKLEGNDDYTLTFHTHQKGLTGLRLDALASPSSPGGGPGTGKDGGFRLTGVKVTATPLVAAPDRKPLTPKLRAAAASFEQQGFELAKAVDGDANSGWSVGGQPGKDHAAVFEFDTDVGFEGGTQITVQLSFKGGQNGLARLRMAMTAVARPVALAGDTVPQAAQEIVAIVAAARAAGKDPTADDITSRAAFRWFRRFDADAERLLSSLDAINAREPKPDLVGIYATSGGGSGYGGNDVYVLRRGEVEKKGDKAQAGFVLAAIAADDAETTLLTGPDGKPVPHPRLGLARFLTSVDAGAGPLTARVIVNRLWHHHFGRGIAATPNDLGTQGEAPTHPDLLDWLAGRLVETGWSLKGIHRLMVTSATYRQAGGVNQAHLSKDPDNLLLWQRRPVRLEGEAIRDALLAAAGTLDTTLYGPGGLDVAGRRRSIYLTVKRSQPVPFLQIFDQPEPNQSIGSRGIATVPTQALTMMNSPFVRAAAEGLAKRGREAVGGSGEAVIDYCFAVALSRQPTPDERGRFTSLLAAREQAAGTNQPLRDAALADICQLIFCLNEFVYVD